MKRIPKNYQSIIFESVDKLAGFPECENLDIKSLRNHQYDFRLCVGRYRVFFDDRETLNIIAIQEVKKRDERTY